MTHRNCNVCHDKQNQIASLQYVLGEIQHELAEHISYQAKFGSVTIVGKCPAGFCRDAEHCMQGGRCEDAFGELSPTVSGGKAEQPRPQAFDASIVEEIEL